jgi:hypothetical protein
MILYCYREEKRKKRDDIEMRSIFDIIRQQAIEQTNKQDETLSALCLIKIIQATIDYLC